MRPGILGSEGALMMLALALYLFDSALLLARDEAVLGRGRRGRWFTAFGADRWRLGGKEPYVPNPLTPHFPLFRLRWSFDCAASRTGGDARLVPVAEDVSVFTPFVVASAVCLFVLLPAALFAPLGTVVTIAVVALLYLSNGSALWLVFRRRMALGLSTRQFGSIAFECLVCPPFAINLVRKLCARQAIDADFVVAAGRLLQPREQSAANAQCLRRLDEQIDYEAEGTPRMRMLTASRVRFTEAPTA